MLLTVREFIESARTSMPNLVDRLKEETGRSHPEEEAAWTASLGKVAAMFERSDLGEFHVQLNGRTGNIALEYRLPAASSWVDLVVLGRGESAPAAVMLELKHWDVAGDQPGPRPGLIRHKGTLDLHPSEQVRGYVEYCQRFHSAVVERGARVAGCTFLTAATAAPAYSKPPHDTLVALYPVFTAAPSDVSDRLPGFLRQTLRTPDPGFASEFARGTYRQDRDFVRALAATLRGSSDQSLVLLDQQRKGFELCLQSVEELLLESSDRKAVILVEGPPGSGKSVVAARLWADLAGRSDLEGDFVFVTTSSAQKTNWQAIFEREGRSLAARGVVKPANEFEPGMRNWVVHQKKKGASLKLSEWRAHLKAWQASGGLLRIEPDSIAVSIIDEAHALIDPSIEGGAGNSFSGWLFHAGPQVFHILRASRLTILFFDPQQSFRDNETTTEEAVAGYAAEVGAELQPKISLAGAQFRCAGSKEYVEWIDRLFTGAAEPGESSRWSRQGGAAGFELEMVGDPGELDEALRARIAEGRKVRLVAAYGREWKTQKIDRPHGLTSSEKDFNLSYERDGRKRSWSRIWNYTPNLDYTYFVQAPEGSVIQDDMLSEVGCPYVVRGFDFDYVGLLWLSDLVWRKDRWFVQIEHTFESAWRKTLAAAKKERKAGIFGPAEEDLLRRAIRGYRILLTRPIRGCYVWCEDAETREHLRGLLAGPQPEVTH